LFYEFLTNNIGNIVNPKSKELMNKSNAEFAPLVDNLHEVNVLNPNSRGDVTSKSNFGSNNNFGIGSNANNNHEYNEVRYANIVKSVLT
jgi:hypothetical protein